MVDKSKCVGCMACVSVCPTKALYIDKDQEGFNYPILLQNMCINCNACKRVCPVLEIDEKKEEAMYYAMKSKNFNIQINSASGGVFPEIAQWILRDDGIVWGAKFDSNFDVRHDYVVSENELPLLCRSKYVQSDMTNVYESIRRQLRNGKKVLFSGTPCQTTALAKFVGSELKSNLYLVDIICHGVPSPGIWQEYLDELCKQKCRRKEDIIQICFKYKNNTEKTWLHPGFYVKWKDGTEYIDFSANTWYEKGFLGNLYVRPSCHKCKFKSLRSTSDITIGDFWGCKELYPDFLDINGVSLVIIKTKKGEFMKDKIIDNMNSILISKDEASKYNSRLIEPSQKNLKRKKFWKKYNGLDRNMNDMDKLVKKLTYLSLYDRIRNKILRLLK